MKIIVDRMPDSPRDCLFSKYKQAGSRVVYVCTLCEYVPENDTTGDGFKCGRRCMDTKNCPYLELEIL